MKYREFIKQINWGDTTAFVHDSPKERYQYESGEINDAVFAKTTSGTDFDIAGINEFPEVKKVIADNFLAELEPANGVEDDGYNAVKDAIESGKARIGYWKKEYYFGLVWTYMLLL